MSLIRILWNLHTLRKNQWLSTVELEKIRQKKLKALIKHAYDNVPFYHRKFRDSGLKPNDIKTFEDLTKLPILRREDVQTHFKDMVAKGVNIRKCKKYTTSGSTGAPVTIISDQQAEDFRAAVFGFPFFECGFKPWQKMVRFSNPNRFSRNGKRWYEYFGLMRVLRLSPLNPVEEYIPIMRRFHPHAIFGYASYLFLLAEKVKEDKVEEIAPRILFSTADMLTPRIRKFLTSVFDAEVFDLFGCVEVERTAWECKEHVGYHMDIDSTAIEFVKDNEHVAFGERGKILYTCLYNYAMPLIRYDVGDVGIPSDEKCPCGRGLPLMKSIEGRLDDFIVKPDGTLVDPISFLIIVENLAEYGKIKQYQIIQEKKEEIILRIVKGENFDKPLISYILTNIRELVGKEMNIKMDFVDKILPQRSGKFRIVISKVKPKF